MLKTERMTQAVERDVRAAARELLSLSPMSIQTDFEHGQWWVTDRFTGSQWSVVDADGNGAAHGLAFEQVTAGDDREVQP